jgi:hypothetical protein
VLLAAPVLARAEASLGVSGAIEQTSPRLEVRVVVSNRGDVAAAPLHVVGELLGERTEARLAGGVAPGASGGVLLDFPPLSADVRPGVHVLALLLEHPVDGPPDAAGNPPLASQRAWLLLALGTTAAPAPAVTLVPERLRLSVRGAIQVGVLSADGAPHRVRVRLLTARGLRTEGKGVEVAVPAHGEVKVSLPIVRAGAPRGSRHGVVLVAEAEDGPLARATVTTATVDVAPFPSLLPRLRVPLAVAGIVLLATALGVELLRFHLRPPSP